MKLHGPLFSEAAQKTFGGILEFSSRHGKNLVRIHQQPTGPTSISQTVERQLYAEAAIAWTSLTDEERQQWKTFNLS